MPNKKQFVNPLTRSSEEDLNLSQTTLHDDDKTTEVKKEEKRKRFEATHQRVTIWIDQELKKMLDELASDKGVSKSSLIDEAIALLLNKNNRKPYTWHSGKDPRNLKGRSKLKDTKKSAN